MVFFSLRCSGPVACLQRLCSYTKPLGIGAWFPGFDLWFYSPELDAGAEPLLKALMYSIPFVEWVWGKCDDCQRWGGGGVGGAGGSL